MARFLVRIAGTGLLFAGVIVCVVHSLERLLQANHTWLGRVVSCFVGGLDTPVRLRSLWFSPTKHCGLK
jgi:hypothetical protein